MTVSAAQQHLWESLRVLGHQLAQLNGDLEREARSFLFAPLREGTPAGFPASQGGQRPVVVHAASVLEELEELAQRNSCQVIGEAVQMTPERVVERQTAICLEPGIA